MTLRRILAAGGALALLGLAGCANDGYDRGLGTGVLDDGGGVVEGATRPTPDNPGGDVYVTEDGNVYECDEGLVFDC
jgi:hypothetical protein